MKTIGAEAFRLCSSLREVTIKDGVESIGSEAFAWLNNLSGTLTIPSSVTNIGYCAFASCQGLTGLVIRGNDVNVGESAFDSCSALESVSYGGGDIGYRSFAYCDALKRFNFGKVKTIGDNAFYLCPNLLSVETGDDLTSIGQDAFSDCTALIHITSRAKKAPACGSQALEDINKWECKLNVPKGYMSVYQAADQWKDFFFMEEGEYIPPKKGDVNSDGKVDQYDLRDLVEYIMGGKPNGVTEESANVNGDNKVNVADIVALTSLLK